MILTVCCCYANLTCVESQLCMQPEASLKRQAAVVYRSPRKLLLISKLLAYAVLRTHSLRLFHLISWTYCLSVNDGQLCFFSLRQLTELKDCTWIWFLYFPCERLKLETVLHLLCFHLCVKTSKGKFLIYIIYKLFK